MFRRQFAQPIDVDSGFFTTSVSLELADGDSGTTILMQQDNGILHTKLKHRMKLYVLVS